MFGENNKFGHPNEGVLNRLEKLRCKVYRSDRNGEITLYINKRGKLKLVKQV